MALTIRAQTGRATRALTRLEKPEVRRTMLKMAEAIARAASRNMRDQGALFGEWKPASKWTIAKKNTTKLFKGLHNNFGVRAFSTRAEVFFKSTGRWSIDQHHEGFTEAPTGSLVTIQLKRPRALQDWKYDHFTFVSKRASHVPRRRIWPTTAQARQIINPHINSFVRSIRALVS